METEENIVDVTDTPIAMKLKNDAKRVMQVLSKAINPIFYNCVADSTDLIELQEEGVREEPASQ